jgi:hypothetical protein
MEIGRSRKVDDGQADLVEIFHHLLIHYSSVSLPSRSRIRQARHVMIQCIPWVPCLFPTPRSLVWMRLLVIRLVDSIPSTCPPNRTCSAPSAPIRIQMKRAMGRTHVVDVCYTSYECGENSSPHEHISSRPLGKCKVLVHILPLYSSAPVLADYRTSNDERTI